MPLTTDQVRQLASQGPLSTSQVQTLATPTATVATTPSTPTITAASLAPQTPIQPVQTEQPQVPVVSPYTLTADETQAETQETDLSKLIAGLTAETSTAFQEDARLKAEEAQGISAKKSALAGLQNTQKSLLAESQGIQLQLQQDIQNQQNLAQQGGANVTKGGLAPQTRALQTVANQSLLSNAIKQYGNNASLAAAQGDLASAMDYVDRAIQAEFLPKEKALAVAQANLTNLQKSGTLTRAQQKRADERQALIDAQKAALAEEKAIKTDTRDAVVKAISNNTGLPGFDNLDIAALQAAQTPEEVAAILQARGLSVASQADQLDMKVKQAQLDKANYDLAHPNRQTQVIEGANGNTLLIDTNTGATIKDYGAKKAVVDTKAPEVKTINGVDKQWNSSTQEWEDIGSQNGEVSKKISDQLNLLDLSISNAEKYAGASGRSGIRKTVEGATVGATDYTNLEAQINTLKTNMLTLATDPSIKKFFGPQMSNADVRLMMSAATPADPELQDPATLKAELARLKTAVTTMKELANPGSTPGGQMYQNLVTAPDGTRVIITD